MFDFTKNDWFRVTLIAVTVLSCYQPELSMAQHHHRVKAKHVSYTTHKISHHIQRAAVKPATVVAADNVQFTINPNNTIVANNVVLQPVTPEPTAEETGIEILSDVPASFAAKSEPSLVETMTQQVAIALQPKTTIVEQPVQPAVQTLQVTTTAPQQLAAAPPRSYFQFHKDEAAPVQAVTSVTPPASALLDFHKQESPVVAAVVPTAAAQPPHGFFVFLHSYAAAHPLAPIKQETVIPTASIQPAKTASPTSIAPAPQHGFYVFKTQDQTAQPAPVQTTTVTTTQQTTTTSSPHGFFMFHTPETPAQPPAAPQPVTASSEQITPAPEHRFFQFQRESAAPATVAVTVTRTHVFVNIAASMQKHIVDFVKSTVSTLRYSDYKLGGSKFDTSKGIYIVDCSSFVDNILKKVSPHAYTHLVNATGAPTPATKHYYEFFKELSRNSDDYWNKINNVEQLRAGDILVFRTKHNHGAAAGHIMVVMEKPTKDMGVYFVRVADSAPARHSEDTRQRNEGGIGIGTLLLKAAKSGRPFAYAWGEGGYWNKNVNFAMARPTEWN